MRIAAVERWLVLLSVLVLGVIANDSKAFAQEECPTDGGVVLPPDYGSLRDFFPGQDSSGVPLDAIVRLRYVGRIPPRPVVVVSEVDTGNTVPGELSVVGAEVHWRPLGELQPSRRYSVRASELATGGTEFRFTTGTQRTTGAPPRFSGLMSVNFARSAGTDICGDDNAVRVTVTWPRAVSNGWPEADLEYLVFETQGPNIGGPTLRARERGGPASFSCGGGATTQCTSFRLSSANATGRVCFNIQVSDPTGRTDGNRAEACVDPQVGNYFNGCGIARRTGSDRPKHTPFVLTAVFTALVLRRRVRRPAFARVSTRV